MKLEWYMISLIKYINIYDKRLWGKAGFYYLYVTYKIYSIRKCLSVHKKSNGHKKRSDAIIDINIIDFVLIQVERSPKVVLFPKQNGFCLCLVPPIRACVLDLPSVLLCCATSHIIGACHLSAIGNWAHISFSSMFWQPMQLCT